MADLADLETDAGNAAGAQRGYEQALAHLRGKVGTRHPLAIDLQRVLCVIERNNGRVDAAVRYCRDALALALELRGPQDPASIDARRQLAAIHVDQGRFAEAEAAFSQSRVWLISRLGPNHPDVARDDNSIGIIAWERDQPRQALASLDHAIAILRRSPGSSLLSGVLFNKAMILHEVGSDALALQLLQDVRSLRSDQVGSRHPLVGETDRLRGEVLAALGRAQEAEAALRSAAELTRAGYGSRHPRTRRAALSLARFDALRGGGDALARIEAIAAIPGDDSESAKLRWRARAYAAEARCDSGDRVAGRAALALLQADMRAALPEGGEVSREVQAIADACR
jgi:serine/threonine-protein kinase